MVATQHMPTLMVWQSSPQKQLEGLEEGVKAQRPLQSSGRAGKSVERTETHSLHTN